jgi:hypothetical protein
MNKVVSERQIILAVWRLLMQKKHKVIVPNVFLINGESDVLSITKAGYIYEWEVKTSVSDYQAEFRNKKVKHLGLSGVEYEPEREYSQWLENHYSRFPEKRPKPRKIGIPNYFSFVLSREIFEAVSVPDYAGVYLYVCNGHNMFIEEKKKPQRVKSERLATEDTYKALAQKMCYRLYDYYINGKAHE